MFRVFAISRRATSPSFNRKGSTCSFNRTEYCVKCGAIRNIEIVKFSDPQGDSAASSNMDATHKFGTMTRILPEDVITPENIWQFTCRRGGLTGSDALLFSNTCSADSAIYYLRVSDE